MTMKQEVQFSKKDVEKSFSRAAQTYDEAAVLQREIADRLIERLDYIKLNPAVVLDLGCGTGYSLPALKAKYPKARLVALDLSHDMLKVAQTRRCGLFKKPDLVQADAEQLPFADESVDLIFSNFAIQWCTQLGHTFEEFNRILKPGGLVLFTTFGPDTLKELKAAWQAVDQAQHVNDFIDMHDIGDFLVQAQFADPVMDAETITMTYDTVRGLLKDLKRIGAHNVNHKRHHGLTGKRQFHLFEQAYGSFLTADKRYPASYEVVYGHAWATEIRQKQIGPGQFAIPLDKIGGLSKKR